MTDEAMEDSGEVNLDQSSEDDDDVSARIISENKPSIDWMFILQHFCRICDAKATVACKKCDGDEYCLSCFQEFHKEIGEAHKPSRIAK